MKSSEKNPEKMSQRELRIEVKRLRDFEKYGRQFLQYEEEVSYQTDDAWNVAQIFKDAATRTNV